MGGLSSDLISQFVRITNDTKKTPTESTVYGTAVEYENKMYVRLDGSELLTPVTTTADMVAGERVTVLIKNHSATVMGNVSSPSARTDTVNGIASSVTTLNSVMANKVDTEQLNATNANVSNLSADVAELKEATITSAEIAELKADNVTIKETLTAQKATIEDLQADKLDVNVANAQFATIENLNATNADVHNLESTYADFEVATTNKFTAVDASISELEAGQAKITSLETDVADISTLMFGSATGDTIQTNFSNAVIAQLGAAQIKSAMIESVSADKITAGDIITNNVRVKSEDGSLIISDETMQISDENRVRVQIGKDDSGDYSINIWDAAGNLMFSKGGITDSAIKQAIIRNDMVSDTANIAAHKLDIDSLFSEINGSTNTIKSSKVYLDDEKQTLDIAFKTLSTEVSEIQNGVSSQGTAISVMQGQIESKIWQQDITAATTGLEESTETLSTQYEEMQQDLDSVTTTVANQATEINKKADNTTVTSVTNRVATLETGLSGFQSTVSNTYATKTELNDLEIGGRNLLRNTRNPIDKSYWQRGYIILDDDLGENVFYITRALSSEVTIGTHRIRITPGETYTISAWLKRTSNVSSIDFWFLSRGEGSTKDFDYAQGYQGLIPTVDTWVRYTWTFEIPENAYEGYFRIDHNGSTDEKDATIYYTMVKMEKGTKATDWTPAPEDMATAVELETLVNRVSAAETSITQNETEIALKASKTEVTEAINDIAIGGRNLVRDSKLDKATDMWGLDYDHHTISFDNGYLEVSRVYDINYTNRTFNNQFSSTNPLLIPDEIAGETYVIQAEMKAIDGIPTSLQSSIFWRVYYDNSDLYEEISLYIPEDLSTTEWRRCYAVHTFGDKNWTNSQVTIALANLDNGVCVRNIMIERATKPSAWSPAPEDLASAEEVNDIQNRLISAETSITQHADAIELRATKTEVTNAVNAIEIGGRNLVVNSSLYRKDSPYSNTSSAADGTKTNGNMYMSCEPGETYTFQCCTDGIWGNHQTDGTATGWTHLYLYLMTDAQTPGQYASAHALQDDPSKRYTGRRTWTFTVPNNGTAYTKIMFRFDIHSDGSTPYTVNWWDLKAERGNKATDWTPAPEDMASNSDLSDVKTRVTSAETKITQNAGSITAAASRISANESLISSLELTADGLTAEVNTLNSMGLDGRNLLRNTFRFNKDNPIVLSSASKDGYAVKFNGEWIYSSMPIEPASKITLQACTDAIWGNAHGYQNESSKEIVTIWFYWYDNPEEAITAPNSYKHAVIYNADGSSSGRYVWTITAPAATNTSTGKWYVHLRLNTYSDGTEVVTHKVWNVKMEKGTKATEWSPAPEDVTEASKTATNYLNFSSSGLVVGDMTSDSLGKNVLIDSDSVDIRNGSTVMASFGANTITLGQNAENSVIDLCDGAGKITTMISETENSYPAYDSIAIESQRLNLVGKRIYMNTSGSSSTYASNSHATLMSSTSGFGSEYTPTSTGKTNKTGVSSDATDNYVNTYTKVYANGYNSSTAETISNSVTVYPLRTQFSRPISIQYEGIWTEITGANKVLWSGNWYMNDSQSCTLSEGIYDQTNGVVLIFSEYIDGASSNTAFHEFFIPKEMVILHSGSGHCLQMATSNLAYFATKYLYISNTKITGHANNVIVGDSTCGITRTNTRFIMRYVIGV